MPSASSAAPEADGPPADHGIGPVARGAVEGLEHRVGAIPVALADELARKVQYRLQGEFHGRGGQRSGLVEYLVLPPAQGAGEIRQAAVGGDQRRLVAHLGRPGDPAIAVARLRCEFPQLPDAGLKRKGRRARARHQRKPCERDVGRQRPAGAVHDSAPLLARSAAGSHPNTTALAVLARTAWVG